MHILALHLKLITSFILKILIFRTAFILGNNKNKLTVDWLPGKTLCFILLHICFVVSCFR